MAVLRYFHQDPRQTSVQESSVIDKQGTVLTQKLTTINQSITNNTQVLEDKLNSVPGKSLSTNDFTDEYKNKLREIEEGALVNVQSDWGEDDNTADSYIKNKPVIDDIVTQNSENLITSGAVFTAIDELPEPMIFKGSLGTGGTIQTLPAPSADNVGFVYKVITAGTYYGITAKPGDSFISDSSDWILIPSGDEPEGTVMSVGLSVPTGLLVSGSPITTSGTLAITYALGYAIPTTAKLDEWDAKQNAISDLSTIRSNASNGNTAYGWGNHANAGYLAAISDLATIRSNASEGHTAYGWGNHANAGYVKSSGVTSVAMTVPTGLAISGSPITSTGTLALSFANGYSIPTTAKQSNWDTAYGWGNHASAGYVKSSGVTSVKMTVPTGFSVTGSPITSTGTLALAFASGYSLPTTAKLSNWDTAYGWGNHANAGYLTGITKAMVTNALGYTPPQQDTNTTYSAGSGLSLSGTTFSLALTKALVTTALGYTPPTTDTNTWRGILNNLTSDSTTDSLSAAQGKALANGSARDSTKLPLAGGTMTGNVTCATSGANLKWGNITIYGGGSNGGINSLLVGDDVTIGDCNLGGIMGMKSTGTNAGFKFFNSSGTSIGGVLSTNGTLQWQNASGTFYNIYHSGNLPAYPTKASWNYDDRYVSSLTTSGNYLRWVTNGTNNDITIPYATSAGTISGNFVFTDSDVPEGATNLSTAATTHSARLYRNGLLFPYQMDNTNDGGMMRVRGTSESNCILELATWDDSGSGETIQFNYYPTTSQITPTYSVSVPKATGTLALTSQIPTNLNQLTNGPGYITGITKTMVTNALGYTPPTSDTNNSVTLTNTATTNGNYRVLMSATADDTTRTEGARKSTNLYFNPSVGKLSVSLSIQNTDVHNRSGGWNTYEQSRGISVYDCTGSSDRGAPYNYYSTALHVAGQYWFLLAFERGNNRLLYRGGNAEGVTRDWTRIPIYGDDEYACRGKMWIQCDTYDSSVIIGALEKEDTTQGPFVGIGKVDPSYKLHVNGACGATSHPTTSDIRIKDIQSDISINLEDIANAPLFLFKWKEGGDNLTHVGTSALYWKEKVPELVSEANDERKTLSLEYEVLGTAGSIAIAKEVVSLKEEIKLLQALIAELKLLLNN